MRKLAGFLLAPVVATLLVCAGCPAPSTSGDLGADLHAGLDATPAGPTGVDVTGRWAAELALGGGAGDAGAPYFLRMVWSAYQNDNGSVDLTYYLCDLPLPGLVDVPTQILNNFPLKAHSASITSAMRDAAFQQPTVALVLGAKLADPLSDALPTDGTKPCSATVTSGCVVPDTVTHRPGLGIDVTGAIRDMQYLFIDLRVRFAFDAVAPGDATLSGKAKMVSVEAHVLDCQHADGTSCTAQEIAQLEKQQAPLALTDGRLRSHAQGPYFTCPQFLDNPEGAVTGTEVQDGGMPDLPLGGMSFQSGIQSDIDERGCATGGCHEVIDGPGKLHLIFRPRTADELLRNYEAVLPFTHGDQPGGRFVNQTPLPEPLRQRWIRWISDGQRY